MKKTRIKSNNHEIRKLGKAYGVEVVCCSTSKTVVKELDKACEEEGVSRSEYIRSALLRSLGFRAYCQFLGTHSKYNGGAFVEKESNARFYKRFTRVS